MRKIRNSNSLKMTRRLLIVVIAFMGIVNCAQAQQDNREEVRRHILRARTAYSAGEFEDALSEYKKALNLAPQYPELYKAIGDVHEKLGSTTNLSEAIIYFNRYLELDPNAEDSRTIQDKVYALQYRQEKSAKQDYILDDLSGTWVAIDNLEIFKTDKKTEQITWLSDFVFEISEIQNTGKYRVTIVEKGSRCYKATITDKTVNIVPQKDASFNFTIVDAQVHTPNQGGYAGARGAIGILQNFGIIPSWLGEAGNVAVDIAQSNDLPSNTQTAYIFALRYIDGELKGLVNVVQKFANPNQQRTLENGLHAITFVKDGDRFLSEMQKQQINMQNLDLILPMKVDLQGKYKGNKYMDNLGNKLLKKEIISKIMNLNPKLAKEFRKAKSLEAAGWGLLPIYFWSLSPLFIWAGSSNARDAVKEYNNQIILQSKK